MQPSVVLSVQTQRLLRILGPSRPLDTRCLIDMLKISWVDKCFAILVPRQQYMNFLNPQVEKGFMQVAVRLRSEIGRKNF